MSVINKLKWTFKPFLATKADEDSLRKKSDRTSKKSWY